MLYRIAAHGNLHVVICCPTWLYTESCAMPAGTLENRQMHRKGVSPWKHGLTHAQRLSIAEKWWALLLSKRNTTPERNKTQEGGSPKRFKLSPDMIKPNFGNDTDLLYARGIYTRWMEKNCAGFVCTALLWSCQLWLQDPTNRIVMLVCTTVLASCVARHPCQDLVWDSELHQAWWTWMEMLDGCTWFSDIGMGSLCSSTMCLLPVDTCGLVLLSLRWGSA